MRRRDFLRVTGAVAALTPATKLTAQSKAQTTVLCDDRSTALDKVLPDTKDPQTLWVRKADLPRVNGFEVKPQGACRDDVCIPIPKDMTRGEYFNLSAFARKVGQSAVADTTYRVWSFGEIPAIHGVYLNTRISPDFAVPDRKGRVVRLSDFRGKKVIVVTWASW